MDGWNAGVVCVESMHKLLVTGGAGFIGSHVVERLIRGGYDVRVIDNFSSSSEENFNIIRNMVELVHGDIRDQDVTMQATIGVDGVIHLAAKISVEESLAKPLLYHDVNATGTLNLLDCCVKQRVRKFIYISTSAVYGDPISLPINEIHPTNPLSAYAASKLSAEDYCRMYGSTYGLDTVILRLFNVYGPRQASNDYAGVIIKFIECMRIGRSPVIFGDGEQTRDFTYVEDIVEALMLVIGRENLSSEIYNIGSGRAVSINMLAQILAEIYGLKLQPIHKEPRKGDIRHSYANIERANKTLNYQPNMRLEDGLRRLA